MVYMIESQINHVIDALRVMRERGAAVAEVRPEVQDAYNRELDAKMARTVWNTGCASWYLDDPGRNADAVARLDLALPPAHPPLRPGAAHAARRRARARRGPGVSARVILTGASGGIGGAASAALRARGAA